MGEQMKNLRRVIRATACVLFLMLMLWPALACGITNTDAIVTLGTSAATTSQPSSAQLVTTTRATSTTLSTLTSIAPTSTIPESTTASQQTTTTALSTTTTTTAPLSADDQAIVHITRTGEKYHRAGCRYLRQSDMPVTLVEAKERGYDP